MVGIAYNSIKVPTMVWTVGLVPRLSSISRTMGTLYCRMKRAKPYGRRILLMVVSFLFLWKTMKTFLCKTRIQALCGKLSQTLLILYVGHHCSTSTSPPHSALQNQGMFPLLRKFLTQTFTSLQDPCLL